MILDGPGDLPLGAAIQARPGHLDRLRRLVRVWGPPDTLADFPAALTQGDPAAVDKIETGGFVMPGGMTLVFIDCADDGTIVGTMSSMTNTTDLYGSIQAAFVIEPDERDAHVVVLPTTTGATEAFASTFATGCVETVHCYGGADTSDVQRWVDDDGEEHILLLCAVPYSGWKITGPTGKGVYRTIVVLTKIGGTWQFDADLSRTAGELRASNPTLGPQAFSQLTNNACLGAETYHGSRGAVELEAFPNGHVLGSQYFQSAGGSAGVFILDENLHLAAFYKFPDFYDVLGKQPPDPDAKRVGFACRSVQVDVSATDPTDLRFWVFPDTVPAAAIAVTTVERTADLVTLTLASNHSLGPGSHLALSGFAGDLAFLNPAAFQFTLEPVYDCPSANTLRLYWPGDDLAPTATGGHGTMRVRQHATVVEMSYNATTGVIVPKSRCVTLDPYRSPIGIGRADSDGTLWVNYGGTVSFVAGPVACFRRDPDTGERRLVTEHPYTDATTFAHTWGEVCRPDYAFQTLAGPASLNMAFCVDDGRRHVYRDRGDTFEALDYSAGLDPTPELLPFDTSFEAATLPPLDQFYAALTRTTEAARTGTHSLKVANNLPAPDNYAAPNVTFLDEVDVEARDSLIGGAWIRAAAGQVGWVRATVNLRDTDGTVMGQQAGPFYRVDSTAWTWVEVWATAWETAPFTTGGPPAATAWLALSSRLFPYPTGAFYVEGPSLRRAPARFPRPIDLQSSDLPAYQPVATGRPVINRRTRRVTFTAQQVISPAARTALGAPPTGAPCPPLVLSNYLYEVDLTSPAGPGLGSVWGAARRRPPIPST